MIVNKTSMFRYQGRSMWPCFQEGDLLEYEPCSATEISIGDCVVFRDERERHVTHRAIATIAKGETLTTRGDALNSADKEPVHSSQVIGKVIRCHRIGQVSKVRNGRIGQVAGLFYRYAGRIDPQRNARGGKLARGLQNISMQALKPLWNKGRTKRLVRSDEGDVTLWVLGKVTIGRQDHHTRKWTVAWPWNILVRIREDFQAG